MNMMKRNLYLIFTLLFAGVLQMQAQQMIVQTSDGNETKFEELDYSSCKITFSNGQMHFHVGNDVRNTFDIKDVLRMSFYGLQSVMNAIDVEDAISYSSEKELLVADVQPGTYIVVYRINGTQVLSQVQTIASSAISVAHLPAGIYVAVAGNETLKFVKK